MSVDLCALASVSAEKFELSKSIYRAFPIWMCFGMHPAASAEVLAGADIQAGKHSRAEKILFLIKELRESIYGAKHEMIVAVYADLGDFYGKARQFSQSDFWYAKSIALSQQIKGPTGYGRPLTGLANSLREQGKLEPASRLYAQALSMRERIYGPGSTKVAETLEQFARLKLLQGDQQGAAQMLQRSQAIGNAHRTAQNANPTNIFIMLIFSWTAGYLLLGPKGLLTGLAVKILVNKIRTGEAPSPADLNRLETLQAYQARPVFLINLRKGF
jgi:tetratricopeptide (TPR) repeat protein